MDTLEDLVETARAKGMPISLLTALPYVNESARADADTAAIIQRLESKLGAEGLDESEKERLSMAWAVRVALGR